MLERHAHKIAQNCNLRFQNQRKDINKVLQDTDKQYKLELERLRNEVKKLMKELEIKENIIAEMKTKLEETKN